MFSRLKHTVACASTPFISVSQSVSQSVQSLSQSVQSVSQFSQSVSQSVQSLSRVRLFCNHMDCSMPGFPVHHQFPELAQTQSIESVWYHPNISSSVISLSSGLQSFPASGSFQMSQFFTSGGQSIGVSSFSISPSNEYSGLISSRIDWLDLLAVQETLNSLLQYHSSKASILWHSAFFMVQLSHPYMTIGKTIALTRRTLAE